MKVVSIVGARPQFIKAAVVSQTLRKRHSEILIHTGQHYDHQMSQVFFEELNLPRPDVNLEVGSGSHGWQTGHMLIGIEQILITEKPDWVLVYGDTNSTLAGTLAAVKLGIKVAHVEAGLRSFNRAMPEELNRVATDHLSDLLFCPSQTAIDNLGAEGITKGAYLVGDVMADVLNLVKQRLQPRPDILTQLGVDEGAYLLATMHRPENTDNPTRLHNILTAFNTLPEPLIFPVHPRTRKVIEAQDYSLATHIRLIEPVGYLDMIRLAQSARMILTDSGGLQKEAYWLGIPCITMRDETEWVETVEVGWNVVVGADPAQIVQAVHTFTPPETRPMLYGAGQAAQYCVACLEATNSLPLS